MPEEGWYSLTVRANTARMVGELAKAKGLTVDEFLNELMHQHKVVSGSRAACAERRSKLQTYRATWLKCIQGSQTEINELPISSEGGVCS